MAKLMVFIDGTWLYHSKYKLGDSAGSEDYALDYGKLPQAVARQVAAMLPGREVDIVRSYLFGSCASNYDSRDEDMVQRQKDFFAMLKEKYHYEVEIFPIDFRGRRLRRVDRRPDDNFEPREKCVDIALASSIMFHAAMPSSYDIAVVVVGDEDFVPVLQQVRRLGKRVAIASIKTTCCSQFADPYDAARIKDFDTIWLDDMVDELELNNSRHRVVRPEPVIISSPTDRVQTWSPSEGGRYDSDEAETARFRRTNGAGYQAGPTYAEEYNESYDSFTDAPTPGSENEGYVKTKFDDRGYGFIHGNDGLDYFFHVTDLRDGLEFHDMVDGLPVVFQVKKVPEYDKAGAAQNVRLPSDFEFDDDGYDDADRDLEAEEIESLRA